MKHIETWKKFNLNENTSYTSFTEEQISFLKNIAKMLVDDGENVEYTRGICELIAEIDGIEDIPTDERAEQIRQELLDDSTYTS